MDPLTHTLTGLTLVQAGLRRHTYYATAALVIGANLPDVDALAAGVRTDVALCVRRGWTHGVLAAAVFPLLLVGGILIYHRLFGRKTRRPPDVGRLIWLSSLAVLTHPFLDWLNNYGVRLLMPFDGRWFYGDAVFIIDPWLWLTLGSAVFLHRSASRVGLSVWITFAVLATALLLRTAPAELWLAKALWIIWVGMLAWSRLRRVGQSEESGRRLAKAALALAFAYIGWMLLSARHARHVVADMLRQQGVKVEELMVAPLPVNPFARDVVFSSPAGYRYGTLTLLPGPRLELAGPTLPNHGNSPVILEALHSPEVRGFVNWARFPFAEVDERDDGYDVWLMDARYVRSRQEGFGAARVFVPKQATRLSP